MLQIEGSLFLYQVTEHQEKERIYNILRIFRRNHIWDHLEVPTKGFKRFIPILFIKMREMSNPIFSGYERGKE